ncbi:MAG: hypothetical protein ACO3KY_11720 [Lysobacterales bacterium]
MRQLITLALLAVGSSALWAGGTEEFNTCRNTSEPVCERMGSCSIQGSSWFQHVLIDKRDKFDTQGWPGLCDMTHVALVRGNCDPLGAREGIIAILSARTIAEVPLVEGTLACGGDSGSPGGGGGGGGSGTDPEICDDGLDNDLDGKTDCMDRKDCKKSSACR